MDRSCCRCRERTCACGGGGVGWGGGGEQGKEGAPCMVRRGVGGVALAHVRKPCRIEIARRAQEEACKGGQPRRPAVLKSNVSSTSALLRAAPPTPQQEHTQRWCTHGAWAGEPLELRHQQGAVPGGDDWSRAAGGGRPGVGENSRLGGRQCTVTQATGTAAPAPPLRLQHQTAASGGAPTHRAQAGGPPPPPPSIQFK